MTYFTARFVRALISSATLAGGLLAEPAGAPDKPLISDPVEEHDGWKAITSGSFVKSTTAGGLLPYEGGSYFSGKNLNDAVPPATNRGIAKYFRGCRIEPGVYTATFLIGKPDGVSFVSNLMVMLIADVDGDGIYTWGERIPGVVIESVQPTPVDGEWATWRLVSRIDETTRTVDGFPVVGVSLGLMMVSNTKPNSGYAFDYLRIGRTASAPR